MKDSLGVDDDFGSETAFSFDFGSDIQIPILKDPTDANAKLREDETSPTPTKSHLRGKAMKHLVSGTDKDVAAYKRVIWEDIDEYGFHLVGLSWVLGTIIYSCGHAESKFQSIFERIERSYQAKDHLAMLVFKGGGKSSRQELRKATILCRGGKECYYHTST